MNLYKITAIIIAFALLISCKPFNYIEKSEALYFGDLRKYTEKGFLITPGIYPEAYESVGIIDYVLMPEAKFKAAEKSIYDDFSESGKWVQKIITYEEILDSVYNICVSIGADALMDFKLLPEDSTYRSVITIQGLRVSGVAIKRK